jgi:hypothetical protein
MKNKFTPLVILAALGFSGLAAHAAPVYPDFTVQEGSVSGNANNLITADKLNGAYTELLSIQVGAGPTDIVFSSSSYVDFGAFFGSDGTVVHSPSQLNALNGYGLYAVFYAKGKVVDGETFVGQEGEVRLYIDPDQDTRKSFSNTGTVVRSGSADDYEVGSGVLLSGNGGNGINGSPGAFNFLFEDFQLTPKGKLFFTSPKDPFYQFAIVNGDFDGERIEPGVNIYTGDVSAVFNKIPEPGSFALFGIGLIGLALMQRRRNCIEPK